MSYKKKKNNIEEKIKILDMLKKEFANIPLDESKSEEFKKIEKMITINQFNDYLKIEYEKLMELCNIEEYNILIDIQYNKYIWKQYLAGYLSFFLGPLIGNIENVALSTSIIIIQYIHLMINHINTIQSSHVFKEGIIADSKIRLLETDTKINKLNLTIKGNQENTNISDLNIYNDDFYEPVNSLTFNVYDFNDEFIRTKKIRNS